MKIIKIIYVMLTITASISKASELSEEATFVYLRQTAKCHHEHKDKKASIFLNPVKILNLSGIFKLLCISQFSTLEIQAYGFFQSKNLTRNVWDHFMGGNYKMALGCPTEKEIEHYLPNGLYAPWLPCKSLNNSEDCYSIRPLIESDYATIVEANGNYDIGYNMGYAYEMLEKDNKLKCTITGASQWKDLNLQRLYQLVGTYGQNIRILNSENESIFSWRMNNIVNEMINKIQNLNDQKKLKRHLKSSIKNKITHFSLNNSNYQPHISLNIPSDPSEAIKKLARAFKKNLIITNMVVSGISDSELIELVDGFQHSPSLDTLYISCLENTIESASALAKMLFSNKSLRFLSISNLLLTEDVIVDFSKALENHPVLENFTLDSSNITESYIQILRDTLSNNKRLKIISSANDRAGSIRIEIQNPPTI